MTYFVTNKFLYFCSCSCVAQCLLNLLHIYCILFYLFSDLVKLWFKIIRIFLNCFKRGAVLQLDCAGLSSWLFLLKFSYRFVHVSHKKLHLFIFLFIRKFELLKLLLSCHNYFFSCKCIRKTFLVIVQNHQVWESLFNKFMIRLNLIAQFFYILIGRWF